MRIYFVNIRVSAARECVLWIDAGGDLGHIQIPVRLGLIQFALR